MKSVNQAMNEVFGKGPEMEFIGEKKCKGCGQLTRVFIMTIIGGPDKGKKQRVAYGCKCEDIKLVEKTLETKRRMERRKMMDLFDRHSMINRNLLQVTFDDYEPRNKSEAYAKRVAMRYVEIFDPEESKNITFYGPTGVGKSHLAKSIADGVMDRGYSAVFITIPTLLRKLRSTYNKESEFTEDQLYSVLEKVDLLVLDDVGVEKDSEWVKEKMFDLINARQGMNTIYTSNYAPVHMEQILTKRIYSRMAFQTEEIEILSDNYRLKDKNKPQEEQG